MIQWTEKTAGGWTWYETGPIAHCKISKNPVYLKITDWGDFYKCGVVVGNYRCVLTWTAKSLETGKAILEKNIEYALDHILKFYK